MRIDKMPAGREMDYMIGKEIMKLKGVREGTKGPEGKPYKGWEYVFVDIDGSNQPVPNYSTDIAVAWEVVEKLNGSGCQLALKPVGGSGIWECKNLLPGGKSAQSGNVPLAICRAALKAMGVQHETN